MQKANRYAVYPERTFQPNEGENILDWEYFNQEEGNIRLTTPKEIATEIKENINPKKALGCDLITGEILNQLPRK